MTRRQQDMLRLLTRRSDSRVEVEECGPSRYRRVVLAAVPAIKPRERRDATELGAIPDDPQPLAS